MISVQKNLLARVSVRVPAHAFVNDWVRDQIRGLGSFRIVIQGQPVNVFKMSRDSRVYL